MWGANGRLKPALSDLVRFTMFWPIYFLEELGMLREQTKEYIYRLSDVDLMEYIQTGTLMYLPEAVEYAQDELDRRKLTPVQISEIGREASQHIAAKTRMAIANNSRPLGWGGRLAAFLFGLCLGFHFLLHMLAEDPPETRRAEDWQKFERIGFGAMIMIVIAICIAFAARKPL